MSPVYPTQWLDSTFTSRARTEQLLRPELESGFVTEHDFNLASSFLPGYHRYWPVRTPLSFFQNKYTSPSTPILTLTFPSF